MPPFLIQWKGRRNRLVLLKKLNQVVNKKEGTLASWTRGNNDRDFSVVFGASLKKVRSDCLESFGALIEYYKEEEYIVSLQQSKNKKKLQALLFVQPSCA